MYTYSHLLVTVDIVMDITWANVKQCDVHS